MSYLSRASAAAVAAAVFCSAQAYGAGRDCTGYGALSDNPTIDSAKVTGDGKTFFVKSEMDDKACPADTGKCRRKAFLVPGNGVLVSSRSAGFVCATFVNGKGVETSGWLPAAAIVPEAPGAAPTAETWAGTWLREEAKIKIKPGANDALAIAGDATYGALDPDRVKRGDVNMGNIAAKVSPKADRLSFAMGEADKTLPVDKADDSTCKVWMRRVGPYLLVDDNNMCGGANVSFRGTYAHP